MDKVRTIRPLSRGLPKTGQITEVIAGDDGTYEKGWWLGRLNANNRTRFIEKELVTDEKVIIDLATKLIWPKNLMGVATDSGAAKNFADCIAFCEALDYGGFSDWRLPNIIEMISLFNAAADDPAAHDVQFDNWVSSRVFWSATILAHDIDNAYYIQYQYGLFVHSQSRGASTYFLPVRSV